MDNALISIIIPIYNVEDYLEECLQSIAEQTYQNIQIILVDDGSTDSSGKICDDWEMRDERIVVIHQENGGISSARNCGMKIAEGEYFTFLDSDDMYHKDFLKTLYEVMQQENVDIVQCGIERFQDKESLRIKEIAEDRSVRIYTGREMNRMIYTVGNIDNTVVWNKMYKKSIFANTIFPVGRLHEDTFVTYKLFYETAKVALIEAKLYFYRHRPGSIMNKKLTKRNLDMLDAFEERLHYYQEVKDEELYRLCLGRYFYSATVLYGKAVRGKSEDALINTIYCRAQKVYGVMKKNKQYFSKLQLCKGSFFLRSPKMYCGVARAVNGIKRRMKIG